MPSSTCQLLSSPELKNKTCDPSKNILVTQVWLPGCQLGKCQGTAEAGGSGGVPLVLTPRKKVLEGTYGCDVLGLTAFPEEGCRRTPGSPPC